MRQQFVVLLILFTILIMGCHNRTKLLQKESVHRVKTYLVGISNEHKLLKDAKFAGTLKSGKIQVSYQSGLQAQADCIASLTDKAFSHIQKSTGFQTSYDSFTIYLLRTDATLWDACKIVTTPDNSDGVILLVRNEEDSCESIISQNSDFHSAFFHEIIEGSLLFRKEGVPIKGDSRGKKFGFINRKVLNYTRWFREGFSSYYAYLAYEAIISDEHFDKSKVFRSMLLNGSNLHPFSALTKIGNDLFSWHQFSVFAAEPNGSPNMPYPQKTTFDYYEASFGLFLLIRDKFGEDAIRQIIRGIDTLEYADGPALIKLTNNVLNTDIKQLIGDFHFPQTGVYMDPLFPGMAESLKLGISEGCVSRGAQNQPPMGASKPAT